jgi:hypothetical protein
MGKGKVASSGSAFKATSQTILSDTEVSSDDDLPLQRRKRLYHSDRFTVGRPLPSVQHALGPATASQPNPKVVASMATGPGGSGHSGFTMSVKEAVGTTVAKEVADAATAKETTVE